MPPETVTNLKEIPRINTTIKQLYIFYEAVDSSLKYSGKVRDLIYHVHRLAQTCYALQKLLEEHFEIKLKSKD